jgi:hypothetical protein
VRYFHGISTACFTVMTVCIWSMAVADVPETQAGEVEHLISYLENSDCSMVRNGKSHSGREGAKHVRRKYHHFRAKISSTEEFIELSATKSTMSGRLYEVHCPGKAPVTSRDWMLAELKNFRAR